MPEFSHDLTRSDRRLAHKWRLEVVGFYGSLLAIMLALAATTSQGFQVAGTDVPSASLKK